MNSAANVFTSVGSLFTGWGVARGNQAAGPGQTVVIPGPGQQPNNNNTALWVGIIVVAAVVGGLLWWIVKKKK
jgi:LPXTG-motif cell wall-anchored protein